MDSGDWRGAQTLYTGTFLEGVCLDWSSELEEWVYNTREYLAERVQHALLSVAEAAAKKQDYSEALRLTEQAYKLPGAPPAEPRTLERLYRLLVASRSSFASEIRKELDGHGIPTTLTPERARAGFNPASTPNALPMRATSFVGRDAELIKLGQVLAQPACQLLTLLGGAGVGKTRLALQFAQQQLGTGNYPDGVHFVTLETSQQNTFLLHLAQQLSCPINSEAEALEQLGTFLETKNALIILDNFEHLNEAAQILSLLVRRCSGLKLLVTSRARLELEEEYLFLLDGLGFPEQAVALHDAMAFDAVLLFQQRAKQARADFSLEDELADVLTLCRLLEGSPLGIELAVGSLRLMSCAEISFEIRKNLDFLESTTRNLPERHRSLRAAFDYSWRLLSAHEQETLAKLAVFQGGFTREAASKVVGATIPMLVSLVDKSLIRFLRDGRYNQHPLIAHYTEEKLQKQPALYKESRDKHAAYYVWIAKNQEMAVQQGRQKDALHVLQVEWQNIRTLFEYSLEQRNFSDLQGLLELLEMVHDARGSYAEALEFLSRAQLILSAHGPEGREVLGSVLVERAWFEMRLGRYEVAKTSVLEALLHLKESSLWQITGLNVLGILERRTGAYKEAKRACERGLALAREYQDELYIAKMLASFTDVEEVLGDHTTSERYFLEAIALYRKHGQMLGLIRNLNNLGWLYYVAKRLNEAKATFERGLRYAREIDFKQTIPYLLNNLGYIAFDSGQFEQAGRLNEEALELARGTGERALQAEILTSLARISTASGRNKQAQRYIDEALQIAWSVPYITLVLQALLVKGELLHKAGDPERAAGLFFLVKHHPAVTSVEQTQAQELLAQLQTDLGAEQLVLAEGIGRATSLEEAVEVLAT